MKYIFLDIDGVLNNATPDRPRGGIKNSYEIYQSWINPECLSNFKLFLSQIKCEYKIILSSTWRSSEVAIQVLKDNGIAIHDITPSYFIKDVGHTPRGTEIYGWCYKNNIRTHGKNAYNNCLIIDDDSDFLISQLPAFVHVNGYKGFTEKNIKKALKIINGVK